jgi:hypothetical protein
MFPTSRTPIFIGLIALVLVALGLGLYIAQKTSQNATGGVVPAPQNTGGQGGVVQGVNGLVTLALGQTGQVGNVTITPRAVAEDSRCPSDVQCIQAGTVRVRATVTSGLGTADQVFILGEPVTTEAEAVTLVRVEPAKVSTSQIQESEYRFTFKVEGRAVTYKNATADLIQIGMPQPGAVTGKTFRVSGQARGNWFFEASFPIDVLDKDGKKLATVVAQAQGEWMTTDFVPFVANVAVPESYIGPATIVLNKDNPSGLPANDASASYNITIEY